MTFPPDVPGQPGQPGPSDPPPPPPGAAPWEDVADLTVPGAVPPEPETTPAPRTRRRLVAGSAAAAVVVLGGAGAWAFSALSGGGAQPESVLPESAILFADIDLDPSAAQKVNLLRLANKVPDLAETLGIDLDEDADLKQLIAEAVTRSGECDIDYATDIEPWIGQRAGIGAVPGEDEPVFVVVLAVTDESAARAAIESGLGCGEGAEPEQVAFSDGFAVMTDGTVPAADVVADAARGSLADDDAFAADMAALGDTGLVSFWVDVQAAALLDDSAAELGDLAPDVDALTGIEGYRSVAGTLRARSDSLEIAAVTAADEELLAPQRGASGGAVADLPDTTLLALGTAVDPDAVDTLWEKLPTLFESMGEDQAELDDAVATLGDQYDIHLPDDLRTFLGEQIVVAVDSEGLEDVLGMSGISDLDVGLRTVGDAAALQDLADRINALVTMTGVDPLATAETGDGLAIATNDDYAQALTSGGLGESEAFRSVVSDENAASVVFLDIDRLATVLSGVLPGEEALDYLEPLRALGVTGGVDGDHLTSTVRLSFD